MKLYLPLLLLLFSTINLLSQEKSPGMVLIELQEERKAKPPLLNNHELIPPLLKEFYDGARFYKVGYHEISNKLEAVYFVKSDLNMLGEIVGEGQIILLNEELIKFPNLTRVILFRQFGKLYSLPDDKKKGRAIMGTQWELNERNEFYAFNIRQHPYQREAFFLALAEKHPIEKRQ